MRRLTSNTAAKLLIMKIKEINSNINCKFLQDDGAGATIEIISTSGVLSTVGVSYEDGKIIICDDAACADHDNLVEDPNCLSNLANMIIEICSES